MITRIPFMLCVGRGVLVSLTVLQMLSASAVRAGDSISSAGNWRFSFDGADTGTGTATVRPDGTISGSGYSNRFKVSLLVKGTVNSSGRFDLVASPSGSTQTGSVFVGQSQGNSASGRWNNHAIGLKGSWQAQRTSGSTEFVSSCAGTYKGHYDGPLNGYLKIQVGKNEHFGWGVGTTGGYSETVSMDEWMKRGGKQGVASFVLSQGRSVGLPKACDISFQGLWQAPIESTRYTQPQSIRFEGHAANNRLSGVYFVGDQAQSTGRFVLTQVAGPGEK